MRKNFLFLTGPLMLSTDGNPVAAGLAPDLVSLLKYAAQWAWIAITNVETQGGPDKLKRAAVDFGEQLFHFVNSLEARAGVLGGFLNSSGVDAIEHMAIMRAVEAGGDKLAVLLQAVVQNVFAVKRVAGAI